MGKEIKLTERTCWYVTDKTCHCESDRECFELAFQQAKLLYCNDLECLYNQKLPYTHQIDKGPNFVPLFKSEGFNGVCTRAEIALARKHINSNAKVSEGQVFTECTVRTPRQTSKARMVDPEKMEHHVYDDPTDSDFNSSAFGVR